MRIFTYIILITFVLLGCFSCRNKFDRNIDLAEKLSYIEGDSAWKILTEIDTTKLTEKQKMQLFLNGAYLKGIYGNPIYLFDEDIKEGDSYFSGKLDSDEIKWNIVKSFYAQQKGDPI